jgi:Domain of unknown function (DUF4145)
MAFPPNALFRDCPWCGLRQGQFTLIAQELEAKRLGEPSRFWSLANCPRCGSFVAIETLGPGNPSPGIVSIYPEQASEIHVEHLPPDVESYYRDAIRVLEAGVPGAAAVQLRKTLEAAAAHHGIDSGPLVKRIQGLIADGLITKDFGGVLDHIRQVGNVGAHAGEDEVHDETARRALRFTTQVLRNLFEIPAELAALSRPADDATEETTG